MAKRKTRRSTLTSALVLGIVGALAILAGYIARATGLPFWGAAILVVIPTAAIYFFVWRVNNPPEYYIPRLGKPTIMNTQAEMDEFYQQHQLMDTIDTKVVGVTYPNHHHVSRQALIPHCHKGDPVMLQFYRYYGNPAYFVVADCGEIGNLNKNLAAELYAKYGKRAIFRAEITSVTGGDIGYNYGCNIRIQVYV